jgi:hypothetical protein
MKAARAFTLQFLLFSKLAISVHFKVFESANVRVIEIFYKPLFHNGNVFSASLNEHVKKHWFQ